MRKLVITQITLSKWTKRISTTPQENEPPCAPFKSIHKKSYSLPHQQPIRAPITPPSKFFLAPQKSEPPCAPFLAPQKSEPPCAPFKSIYKKSYSPHPHHLPAYKTCIKNIFLAPQNNEPPCAPFLAPQKSEPPCAPFKSIYKKSYSLPPLAAYNTCLKIFFFGSSEK